MASAFKMVSSFVPMPDVIIMRNTTTVESPGVINTLRAFKFPRVVTSLKVFKTVRDAKIAR